MREAAGGVVWRSTAKGEIELLAVHRPAYDDWSLPKGGVRRGEPPVDAARREVREETGLTCEVGPELGAVVRVGRKGREKRTRYWAMTAVSGTFAANDEVDRVRWVAVADAGAVLTYAHELVVVDRLAAALASVA